MNTGAGHPVTIVLSQVNALLGEHRYNELTRNKENKDSSCALLYGERPAQVNTTIRKSH